MLDTLPGTCLSLNTAGEVPDERQRSVCRQPVSPDSQTAPWRGFVELKEEEYCRFLQAMFPKSTTVGQPLGDFENYRRPTVASGQHAVSLRLPPVLLFPNICWPQQGLAWSKSSPP